MVSSQFASERNELSLFFFPLLVLHNDHPTTFHHALHATKLQKRSSPSTNPFSHNPLYTPRDYTFSVFLCLVWIRTKLLPACFVASGRPRTHKSGMANGRSIEQRPTTWELEAWLRIWLSWWPRTLQRTTIYNCMVLLHFRFYHTCPFEYTSSLPQPSFQEAWSYTGHGQLCSLPLFRSLCSPVTVPIYQPHVTVNGTRERLPDREVKWWIVDMRL